MVTGSSETEKTQSRERINIQYIGKSSVPGTRAQQKRHPRMNYKKTINKFVIERNPEMRQDANNTRKKEHVPVYILLIRCLLYTSDAADE